MEHGESIVTMIIAGIPAVVVGTTLYLGSLCAIILITAHFSRQNLSFRPRARIFMECCVLLDANQVA